MTAKEIQKLLDEQLVTCKFQLKNVYIYHPEWESDAFAIQPNGLSVEFEIKTSRGDFLTDFKKEHRHKTLRTAQSNPAITARECPNYFYYLCDEGIVDLIEIPAYAGFMEIKEGKITTIKKAPRLHKDTSDMSKVLLTKFYYRCLKLERTNKALEKEIEFYDSENWHKTVSMTPHETTSGLPPFIQEFDEADQLKLRNELNQSL